MSEQNNQPAKKKKSANTPNNVVQLPTRCPADNCGKKPNKMNFCDEHYEWFKEGLITREGHRPKDFDKKHQAYLRRKRAA